MEDGDSGEPRTVGKMSALPSSGAAENNALPILGKLPEPERTGCPVSHSRWAARPGDNGGPAASAGGATPLLRDRPICRDAAIVWPKPRFLTGNEQK